MTTSSTSWMIVATICPGASIDRGWTRSAIDHICFPDQPCGNRYVHQYRCRSDSSPEWRAKPCCPSRAHSGVAQAVRRPSFQLHRRGFKTEHGRGWFRSRTTVLTPCINSAVFATTTKMAATDNDLEFHFRFPARPANKTYCNERAGMNGSRRIWLVLFVHDKAFPIPSYALLVKRKGFPKCAAFAKRIKDRAPITLAYRRASPPLGSRRCCIFCRRGTANIEVDRFAEQVRSCLSPHAWCISFDFYPPHPRHGAVLSHRDALHSIGPQMQELGKALSKPTVRAGGRHWLR